MRVESGHAHANTSYKSLQFKDFYRLLQNCIEVKSHQYKSLNVHLPFEVQHPKQYPNLTLGIWFIKYGEFLKKILGINLYWENAPEENYGKWDLTWGQTEWKYVPINIDLCVDIGHLMIGSKSVLDAKKRIEAVIKNRGYQIKHLHLHINNFKSDQHINDPQAISLKMSKEWLRKLMINRTFIYEKGE